MISSSTKKNYFNNCSNGELEKLKTVVFKYPSLLQLSNDRYTGKNGLYYSVKNLKYKTTDYLLENSLRLSTQQIQGLISAHWRASVGSYEFLKHYNGKIHNVCDMGHHIEGNYSNYLFSLYKSFCFNNNQVDKLIRIMELEKMSTDKECLTNILNEYATYKKSSVNTPAYISTIRDLQIRILI